MLFQFSGYLLKISCMRFGSVFIGLLSGLLLLQTAGAQLINTRQVVKGCVMDDSTQTPIPFVHIFNESQRIGGISDKNGFFKLSANIGDTMVFSSLGYLAKVEYIGDLSFDTNMAVRLTPRLYEIEAVKIKGFRDYADFQQQFLALDLPKTQIRLLQENLKQLAYKEAMRIETENKVKESLDREPGQFFKKTVPIKYKDDLQRENYARVLELENKQRIIDKKYNREIIYRLTKLSQDEMTDFMSFCNFSMEYLLEASEYEILVKIEEKFREYLNMKEKGNLNNQSIFDYFFYT